MNNDKFNLKIFSLQFFSYFLLLNGLKILFELKNIKIAEILKKENSFEERISEIQLLPPDQSAGLAIFDFVFFTTTIPYFIILFGFIILWMFYSKRKYIFINFISSFLILIFFSGKLWSMIKYIFLKPFQLFQNIYLQTILSGIVLISLSVILFLYSNSKKIINPND